MDVGRGDYVSSAGMAAQEPMSDVVSGMHGTVDELEKWISEIMAKLHGHSPQETSPVKNGTSGIIHDDLNSLRTRLTNLVHKAGNIANRI